MFKNLRAEMAREGITIGDIADFLKVRHGTVSDKINGRYRFYYDEVHKIRGHFFPRCSLEYLFETEQQQSHDETSATKEVI